MKGRSLGSVAAIAVISVSVGGPARGQATVLPNRSRAEQQVARRHLSYHLAWSRKLAHNADSAPAIDPAVKLPNGSTATVVYVLAANTQFDCQDASHPVPTSVTYAYTIGGRLLWKQATHGSSRCSTSAPAFSGNWVYSPGFDGKIHKYNAATGAEFKKNGWPHPYTRQPYVEKQSAALKVNWPYLYATTSGFNGDQGHYEGHVVTINLLTNHVNVWNSLCSNIHALIVGNPKSKDYCPDVQSGMFGRGQGVIDPLNNDVYVATGNGPWNGKTDWGDSVLKLSPNGGTLLDAFTPTDQDALNSQDLDLGSTSPAVLPPVTDNGKTWNLLTQGGKGGDDSNPSSPAVIWLVNRDQMGSCIPCNPSAHPAKLGGQLDDVQSPGGDMVFTAPAVWVNPQGKPIVIYADNSGVTAYDINTSGSEPKLGVLWTNPNGASTPVVAGNTLFLGRNGELDADNPANGNQLWSSADAGVGGSIGGVHWEYPAVYGNWVLMTDENARLYAYELKS